MGANSKIEWTDHTFNPWIGCTKVAAGCEHCYAESFAKRFGAATWGPSGSRVMTSEKYWKKPLQWDRDAAAHGVRKRVFCASLADVFEDWAGSILDSQGRQLWECANCDFTVAYDPLSSLKKQGLEDACDCSRGPNFVPLGMVSVRKRLFALIDATPNLDWLLLTKRPENIKQMIPCRNDTNCDGDCPKCFRDGAVCRRRKNVWLLTSVATQEDADRNLPLLLACRELSPVLGISAEPLLGPIDLQKSCTIGCPNGRQCVRDQRTGDRIIQDSSEGGVWVECACSRLGGLSWIIVGGESGPNARPMNPNWAKSIRDQCQAAGVPFHFKQWGEWLPELEGENWSDEAPLSDAFVTVLRDANGSPVDYKGSYLSRVGKKAAGRALDGRTWDGFPEVRR